MIPLKDSVQISKPALVTWTLVAVNLIFFLVESCMPDQRFREFIADHALVPSLFVEHFGMDQLGRVFISMFIHAGLAHLAGNLWFLAVFGDAVEDRVGHWRYLVLYGGSGLLAALVQIFVSPSSSLPLIGASGAIAGVLGAYFYLFPGATVSTLVVVWIVGRIVQLPAVIFLGMWFLLQLGSALLSGGFSPESPASMVAFWCHVAGFLAGIGAAKIMVGQRCQSRVKVVM